MSNILWDTVHYGGVPVPARAALIYSGILTPAVGAGRADMAPAWSTQQFTPFGPGMPLAVDNQWEYVLAAGMTLVIPVRGKVGFFSRYFVTPQGQLEFWRMEGPGQIVESPVDPLVMTRPWTIYPCVMDAAGEVPCTTLQNSGPKFGQMMPVRPVASQYRLIDDYERGQPRDVQSFQQGPIGEGVTSRKEYWGGTVWYDNRGFPYLEEKDGVYRPAVFYVQWNNIRGTPTYIPRFQSVIWLSSTTWPAAYWDLLHITDDQIRGLTPAQAIQLFYSLANWDYRGRHVRWIPNELITNAGDWTGNWYEEGAAGQNVAMWSHLLMREYALRDRIYRLRPDLHQVTLDDGSTVRGLIDPRTIPPKNGMKDLPSTLERVGLMIATAIAGLVPGIGAAVTLAQYGVMLSDRLKAKGQAEDAARLVEEIRQGITAITTGQGTQNPGSVINLVDTQVVNRPIPAVETPGTQPATPSTGSAGDIPGNIPGSTPNEGGFVIPLGLILWLLLG